MARVSRQIAIELILKEIEKGKTFTDTLKVFDSNYGMNEVTFTRYWKSANEQYKALKAERDKKIEAARTKREIARTIHELETRDGQISDLIKMIEAINEELSTGMTNDSRWVSDTLVFDKRPMYAKEFNDKRELKAKLLADLRKIIGLDAPTKTETGHAFADDFWEALQSGKVKIPQEDPDKTFPKIT